MTLSNEQFAAMAEKITALEKELTSFCNKIAEMQMFIESQNKVTASDLTKAADSKSVYEIPLTDEDYMWSTGNGATYGNSG